jgi:DNA polymerase V
VLTRSALAGLQAIFKPGCRYQKAGILLTLLSDQAVQPGSLFDDAAGRARSARRMAAMDAINRHFGRDTLRTGACGIHPRWAAQAANRSPRYTTQWAELPVVR